MSGMYKDQGAERITNEEILKIREELIDIIGPQNIYQTKLFDMHGYNNMLLPNFLDDKRDNGDIDIFLYYIDTLFSPETYITLIEESGNIIDINKNDNTWSILYESSSINKRVQVDLHIIKNTALNCNSYFNYFRVPYFFYIIGMIQKNLGFKLGQNGFFIRVEDDIVEYLKNYLSEINPNIIEEYGLYGSSGEYYILLEELSYLDFLEDYFNIPKEEYFNISNYIDIANCINNTEIIKYNWMKNVKAKYIKRIKTNDKLQKIVPYIKLGNEDFNILKKKIRKEFILNNKDIIIEKFLEKLQEKKEQYIENQLKNELFRFFFKINELSELKNISKEDIYLIADNKDYFDDIKFFLEKANINNFEFLSSGVIKITNDGLDKLKQFTLNNNIQFDEENKKDYNYVLNGRYYFLAN